MRIDATIYIIKQLFENLLPSGLVSSRSSITSKNFQKGLKQYEVTRSNLNRDEYRSTKPQVQGVGVV